jgi:glycerol-3-phosphate O-acyltransferase/dihydroxyacetone phosphate acyltransferase
MKDGPSVPVLGRRERLLKNIANLAVRLVYRSVEVRQRAGETATGPQLGVSNHFGGFADALIQAYALDRVPRYVARDVIWRYPGAKQIMGFVRAIPTHKPEDEGPAGNDQMFRSAHEALGEGDLVMIFPEGITVDDPSIARVKTGAARIALGARASGVSGIQIIPSGIHYDDKATLRSKVWVNIGAPLDLDSEIHRYVAPGAAEDASNHDAVRALTAEIEQRLRRSAPNYVDWEEERTLTTAASIALRSVPGAPTEVDFGDESELSNLLSERPQAAKDAIAEAVERYTADLDAAGLNDRQMVTTHRTRRSFLWRIVWNLLVGLLLVPFALAGLIINLVPFLILWLIGRVKMDPAMAATVKPGSAIVLFGVTWGIAAWSGWTWSGLGGAAVALLMMPLYVYALLALVERGGLIWRAWRGWWNAQRAGLYEGVQEHRTAVVRAVSDAI